MSEPSLCHHQESLQLLKKPPLGELPPIKVLGHIRGSVSPPSPFASPTSEIPKNVEQLDPGTSWKEMRFYHFNTLTLFFSVTPNQPNKEVLY